MVVALSKGAKIFNSKLWHCLILKNKIAKTYNKNL